MLRGFALVFLLVAGVARADNGDTAAAQGCDERAEAKGLRGAARNDYVVACLKESPNGRGSLTPQQQRSKGCGEAARARRMEGAERRGFLSGCTRPPVQKRPKDCAERAKEMKVEGEDRLRFINGCVEGTKTRI